MAFVSHHRDFPVAEAAGIGSLALRIAACGMVMAVAALFAAGHPFLAVWAAVALFAWLLLLGSSRTRDTGGGA